MATKPHILVTAGPTREKIDDVRDWGNIFTGQTGLDVALAFLDLGNVTLLTSNHDHATEYDGYYGKTGMLGVEIFRTHADLEGLLAERMTNPDSRVDVVAMTAAVSDYAPAGTYRIVDRKVTGATETWTVENVSAPKVKSSHGEIAVRGVATKKLVDLFRAAWNFKGVLIKFKLEAGIGEGDLIKVASASRTSSGADLMVANTLAMARPEGGAAGAAYLIDDVGSTRVDRKALAARVVDWVKPRLAARK